MHRVKEREGEKTRRKREREKRRKGISNPFSTAKHKNGKKK